MSLRLAALAVLVLGLPVLISARDKLPPSAGHVGASVTHTLLTRSGSKPTEATAGMQIVWKDNLQTDKSGRVRVLLDDGSILSLGANSSLNVVKHQASLQQTRLELAYGRIRMQVARITKLGENFEVRTPNAVAGVIGTDFGVDATNPNETDFVCISGTVRVYTPDMKHFVDCGPVARLAVKRGQPLPSAPQQATRHAIERWRHITEPGDTLYPDPVPNN